MEPSRVINVDLSGATSKEDIHRRMAESFSFPDYYGMNWDAFWDCTTTLDPMPRKIRISGLKQIEENLPKEATHLKRWLEQFRAEPDGKTISVEME